MPLRSQAQRSYLYANHPAVAREFQRHTPKGKRLPKRKRPISNSRGRKTPLKIDPTRTATLRRLFEAQMRRRFDLLKRSVWELVAIEDAFGLKKPAEFTVNGEFASTHVTVKDKSVHDLVGAVQQQIDSADVVELEDDPHVTVLYGLRSGDPEPVRRLIEGAGPVFLRLGGMSLFETPEYDVLKVDIESNDLRKLNREIGMLDHSQTYREYKPHLTIAYLKSGTGKKYLNGPISFKGRELWFSRLTFSDQEREKTEIVLNQRTLPLFVYGTFKTLGVIDRIVKRDVKELPALLHGWRKVSLPIKDGYYTIVPDADGTVEGDLTYLTRTELARTDAWETRYERKLVTMPDGSDAFAYIWREELPTRNVFVFSCCGREECQGCAGNSRLEVIDATRDRASGGGRIFNLRPDSDRNLRNHSLALNTRFSLHSSSQKIEQFKQWLATQVQHLIIGTMTKDIENSWWMQYVRRGYEQGAGRAFDDVRKPFAKVADEKGMAFYRGTKEEFLRSSFAHPVAVDKVKLLAGRVLTELEGVTDAMSQKMTRKLTDGLVEGQSPREVARAINREVEGVGKVRSLAIARTECLPGDTLVSAAVVRAVFRRWYEGDLVEIKTRSGHVFSATPNHPMLTENGWVSAGLLKEGDNLVRHARQEDSSSAGDKDVERRPATLSQIFGSLQAIGINERVAGSEDDFHGDGRKGKVDILRPHGELRIGSFSPLDKHVAQQVFTVSGFAASKFCGFCARLLGVNQRTCFCDRAGFETSLCQSATEHPSAYSEVGSDSVKGFTSRVTPGHLVDVNALDDVVVDASALPRVALALGDVSGDARFSQDSSDPFLVVPSLGGNLALSEPGEVQLDEVLFTTIRKFSGHVYNLETPFGYYAIDGYYTGNTIRAHAEGQLDSLKSLGVQQVGVSVEWSTAEDEDVCELCSDMDGVVLDIDEARGLIPRHVSCRCSWAPAGLGEDDKDQITDKSDIDDAIEDSLDAEGGSESSWAGTDAEIDEDRPESVL
jgi:2'-5' RNA ligase